MIPSHNGDKNTISELSQIIDNNNASVLCDASIQSSIDAFLYATAVKCVLYIINTSNYQRAKMLANQTNSPIIVVPHYLITPPVAHKPHTHHIQKTTNMITKQRERTTIKKCSVLVKNAAMAKLLPSILKKSNCETLIDLLSLWTVCYQRQSNRYEYTSFGEQFLKQNDNDNINTIITSQNIDISLETPYILNTIYNAYTTLNLKYNIHRDAELLHHRMINYIMNQNSDYYKDLSLILYNLIHDQHAKFCPSTSHNIKQSQDICDISPIIQSTINIFICIHKYNRSYKSFAIDSFEMKFLKSVI